MLLDRCQGDIPNAGTTVRSGLFDGIAVFGTTKMQYITTGACAPENTKNCYQGLWKGISFQEIIRVALDSNL